MTGRPFTPAQERRIAALVEDAFNRLRRRPPAQEMQDRREVRRLTMWLNRRRAEKRLND